MKSNVQPNIKREKAAANIQSEAHSAMDSLLQRAKLSGVGNREMSPELEMGLRNFSSTVVSDSTVHYNSGRLNTQMKMLRGGSGESANRATKFQSTAQLGASQIIQRKPSPEVFCNHIVDYVDQLERYSHQGYPFYGKRTKGDIID